MPRTANTSRVIIHIRSNPAARSLANLKFKKKCAAARVLPYYVPVGGFMLTPRYDDDVDELKAAVVDLAEAALATSREMGWPRAKLIAGTV